MGPPFFLPTSAQDEREAREMVKREQDEAYRLSLEADRKKVLNKITWSSWINMFISCGFLSVSSYGDEVKLKANISVLDLF